MKYCLLLSFFLIISLPTISQKTVGGNSFEVDYVFQLYGQTRRYKMHINKVENGGVRIDWTIFSYQKWLKGSYHISPKGLCCATGLNFIQPVNGKQEFMKDDQTFGLISVNALKDLKEKGAFVCNNTTYRLHEKQKMQVGSQAFDAFFVIADVDNTKMWIWNNEQLPLIIKIENNPLEINFYIENFIEKS